MGIQSRQSCIFRFIRFNIFVTRQVRDSKITLLFTRFPLLTKQWLTRRETIELGVARALRKKGNMVPKHGTSVINTRIKILRNCCQNCSL